MPGDEIVAALPVIPDAKFNLLDFGGKGDYKAFNTDAFKNAIAAIAKAGGGHLIVPAGIYKTLPFTLTSHMDLHLEAGAVIKAPDTFADYGLPDPNEQTGGPGTGGARGGGRRGPGGPGGPGGGGPRGPGGPGGPGGGNGGPQQVIPAWSRRSWRRRTRWLPRRSRPGRWSRWRRPGGPGGRGGFGGGGGAADASLP